jgi:RNA polymerase sigma-70 factor (family 1)
MKMEIQTIKKEEKRFVSFKGGEEKGFDFFFNEYYAALSFFAFKILNDEAAAQDIVSDCYIRLWQRKEVFDAPGSIKSYLYTTIKNACIDLLRSNKRIQEHQKELSLLSPKFEQSIFHKLIEAEVMRLIVIARAKLPTKARRVFEMFYFEDKSYQEIAEELGISINTVKNQKIRAVKLLRKQFPYITLFLYILEQHKG